MKLPTITKLQADLDRALAERDAAIWARDDLFAHLFRFAQELGGAIATAAPRQVPLTRNERDILETLCEADGPLTNEQVVARVNAKRARRP